MINRCSSHSEPGDPPAPEVLWGLLIKHGQSALILCDAGHYVRVQGPPVPSVWHARVPAIALFLGGLIS